MLIARRSSSNKRRPARMAFADEPVDYAGRRFECGWSVRREKAADIAGRIVRLAQRLGAIDPAHGRIRPDPGMRSLRPGDPAPVLDMKLADLADQIDRGGRFDPPPAPAPVSSGGFSLLYRNDLKGLDPAFLSLSVRAGRYGPDAENRVGLQPDAKHEVWRDPERGIDVLDAMMEAWDPEWACAYALVDSEDDEAGPRARPWLAWTHGSWRPRPNPPYRRAYPAPFPLDDAGPPSETQGWHGGELRIWP